MTFGELKESVIRLGFERDLEDESHLLPALRRALYTLFIDLRISTAVKIPRPKFDMKRLFETLTHSPSSKESFTLSGRACSFTLSGEGTYTISSGATSRTYRFSSESTPVRIFTVPGSTITFEGNGSYTVFDLAVTDYVGSGSITDIPIWSERNQISLTKRYSDYVAPNGMPKDSNGDYIDGAVIENGILTLPDSYSGQVSISYRRAPSIPSGKEDERIDVPIGAEELLPLLTASYIWLDDDPDKAQYYMSLYRDGARSFKWLSASDSAGLYVTNGWA